MVLLIDRHNIDRHRDLMEEVYRFRHRAFVEEKGWEALRRPDGREIDRFDTDRCFHLVGVENGDVVSYSRFLPSVEPHLLSHVYPEILDGATYPIGPDIWEWTRLAIAPAKRDWKRGTDPTTARMFVAGAEACQARGISAILGQSHPLMLTRMLELGWRARPLALPREYDGSPIVPLLCGFDAGTLAASRQMLGIPGQVLRIEPSSGQGVSKERPHAS